MNSGRWRHVIQLTCTLLDTNSVFAHFIDIDRSEWTFVDPYRFI